MDNDLILIIGLNIKTLLERNYLKQKELATILGVSESTVGKWILGHNMPRMGVIQKIADYFKVDKSQILGEMPLEKSNMKTIPILGNCVSDSKTIRNNLTADHLSVPESWKLDFAMFVPDDSMVSSGIRKGSLVLCREQNVVEDGDVAICRIDGGEALLMLVGQVNDVPVVLDVQGKGVGMELDAKDRKRVTITGKVIRLLSVISD